MPSSPLEVVRRAREQIEELFGKPVVGHAPRVVVGEPSCMLG